LRESETCAQIHRFGLIDPGEVSGLRKGDRGRRVKPKEIVAVIGKAHGNGLVNDYTRGHLMMSLSQLIGGHTGESAQSVRERVPFIIRGAVGAIVASVLNDTALFVSGGAEHQGHPTQAR
jgi:cyanuric acid amidohydrolase